MPNLQAGWPALLRSTVLMAVLAAAVAATLSLRRRQRRGRRRLVLSRGAPEVG
jgi:hypothetical protein